MSDGNHMTYSAPLVESVEDLVTLMEIESAILIERKGGISLNSFDSPQIEMSNDVQKVIDQALPPGVQLISSVSDATNKYYYGIIVPPGHYEYQSHTVSIDMHTDDVQRGLFFAMLVVSLDNRDKTVPAYVDKTPLFTYFDAHNTKRSQRLCVGDVVVFNPRRPHGVIYFGYVYTVAICTVERSMHD